MSGTFTFILLLVGIVMAANVAMAWLKQRKQVPQEFEEIEATLDKIERLEERVQVLERIITENRFDLKREIDSL